MSPARPPTTPPAIAPMFVFFEWPVSDGFAVPLGTTRVADRAEKVAWRPKYTPRSPLSQLEGLVMLAPPVGLEGVRFTLYPHNKMESTHPPPITEITGVGTKYLVAEGSHLSQRTFFPPLYPRFTSMQLDLTSLAAGSCLAYCCVALENLARRSRCRTSP
jgi:hypothetical protein